MCTHKIVWSTKHGPYFGFARINLQQSGLDVDVSDPDNVLMEVEDVLGVRLRKACDKVLDIVKSPVSFVLRSLVVWNDAPVSLHIKFVAVGQMVS